LDRFLAEQDHRSLFRLDVRTREEYEAGHLPGSAWAEGGQLVQATDQWIGTRHARIVLIDDANGVRAATTASWLIQLGFDDVYTYALDEATETLEFGAQKPLVVGQIPTIPGQSARQLQTCLAAENAVLLDVSDSRTYAAGHIPGACFAIRARLADGLARLPAPGPIFVTGENPVLARLAAGDLRSLTDREVAVLDGGNATWRAAGLPIETGETALHDLPDDVWQSPYHQADRLAAFRRYLDWEIDLVKQISRDRTVSFRTFDLKAGEAA
jgi:rhodanese-related sulfurtransferase